MTETFDWIANTLKPTEGNNSLTHYPTPRPYVKKWVDEEINPFHKETIESFSHDSCRVTFEVDIVDNDMGLLLGKVFYYHAVDTFDLKDIDPQSVHVEDSCTPVDTPSGPTAPWNCEDQQGKIVVLKTIDAKPKIHEEANASSAKSMHGFWGVRYHTKYNLDDMCKESSKNSGPVNGGYCDQSDEKQAPKDETGTTLGFSTPQYALRFAKAFRHAVELCGGKASAF